jgi:hypothetical protein
MTVKSRAEAIQPILVRTNEPIRPLLPVAAGVRQVAPGPLGGPGDVDLDVDHKSGEHPDHSSHSGVLASD